MATVAAARQGTAMDRKGAGAAVGPEGLVRGFGPGATIFEQGSQGEEFFIILDGSVEIASGTDMLATLTEGEFFGEMAILDRRARSATARAGAGGARVLTADAARFLYLVAQQPGFAVLVMEAMSRRFRGEAGALPASEATPAQAPLYRVVEIAPETVQLNARSRACNAYLLRGPDRTVLVDTGLPATADALTDALEGLDVTPSDIDLVVLTHEHYDHVAALPRFIGHASIAAHPLAANKLRLGDAFATMQHAFDNGADRFAVDLELAQGSVIDTGAHRLRVYHTPGHSSGGIALFDERAGLLISGDTVLKGGSIGGVFGSGNASDYVYSLRLMKSLAPRLLLPGHGPLSDMPVADIETTEARCLRLLDESRRLFEALEPRAGVMRVVNAYRDLNRTFAD